MEFDKVASHSTSNRVLIYGINYAPEPLGVGRFSGEIGTYLAQTGSVVEVVTAVPHYPGWQLRGQYRNRYITEHIRGVRVTRCPLLLKAELRGIWRLVAPLSFAISSAPVALWRILVTRPDTVMCVEPTFLAAPMALFAARLIGARCVLHVQDLEVDAAFAVQHLRGAWLKCVALAMEGWLLRRFDKVVTISNRMREKLMEKGVLEQKLAVVRNWVDLEKVKPMADVSAFRAELGIPDGKFIVLYAGNIGPKQALPVLFEAAAQLQEISDILFVLAGDGPEKRRLFERYGHLKNIMYLPIQPEDRLCELLNLASVHVLPQDRGASDLVLPSKLGGMLASGKPSIVMAEPGTELHEFLGDSAVMLSPGDSIGLSEAIVKVRLQSTAPSPSCASRALAFDARTSLPALSALLRHAPVSRVDT